VRASAKDEKLSRLLDQMGEGTCSEPEKREMEARRAASSKGAIPPRDTTPETQGIVSMDGDAAMLRCRSHKHLIAELHDGRVLKIKDRRCKVEVVFDLSSLLSRGGEEA
jgi:hypothetical protein